MELKIDGIGAEIKTPKVRVYELIEGLKDGELVSMSGISRELGVTRESLLGIRKRVCGVEVSTLVNGKICWGNKATIAYINSQEVDA